MSDIDNAIARLQNILTACTTVVFKSAKDYPTDNVEPFPLAVAYVGGGSFHFTSASQVNINPVINLELHFSRVNLLQAYQQIDAISIELPRRLAGDPSLNSTIDSIVASRDEPITFAARPYQWSPPSVTPVITSQMLLFVIPIKTLQTPQATA